MPFCPSCGKEVSEYASFCPNCGTKLAQLETLPTASMKRHPTITASAILLFICAFIHFIDMVDYAAMYEDLVSSIVALFACIIAVVAGSYLWKSKEIGGIFGIAYAVLTGIPILFPEVEYLPVILIVILNTPIIILIIIGWKHLKHP